MQRTQRQKSGRKPRSDAFTLIMHWGLVAALVVSLLSGLRVAADDLDSVAGGLARLLPAVLPEGQVIVWHAWAGWTLTFIAISYAAFVHRSHRIGKVTPSRPIRRRIGKLLSARTGLDVPTWVALNVVLYQVAFVLIAVMAATGWLLYAGVYLGIGQRTIASLHGVTALALLAYVTVHVFAQFKQGMLWSIFRPKSSRGIPAALAVTTAGAAIGISLVVDQSVLERLEMRKVATAPVIDGDGDDAVWSAGRGVRITTVRGANLPSGETPVEVRGVHDGERVYFLFRWADPEPSSLHLPLIKSADGWRVLQSEFDINDEDEFYEDKFAVALSTTPRLGSGTVHLGRNLVPGPHRGITRGLHFTDDGSLVDMWHWKSVRTGGMTPAQVDDNFFGPPLPSKTAGARYTGGYGKDPAEGGGYVLNWQVLDADRPLAEARVVPRYLPRYAPETLPVSVTAHGEIKAELDKTSLANGHAHLKLDEAVPYDPERDDFPVGTIIPSVVIEGAFEGDRGDVLGAASWADGHWTLEVARRLDTGSEFDVRFAPGAPVYLWVAVFNHTQTRHSRHLRPVELRLE